MRLAPHSLGVRLIRTAATGDQVWTLKSSVNSIASRLLPEGLEYESCDDWNESTERATGGNERGSLKSDFETAPIELLSFTGTRRRVSEGRNSRSSAI
jgi:hypothetical protein